MKIFFCRSHIFCLFLIFLMPLKFMLRSCTKQRGLIIITDFIFWGILTVRLYFAFCRNTLYEHIGLFPSKREQNCVCKISSEAARTIRQPPPGENNPAAIFLRGDFSKARRPPRVQLPRRVGHQPAIASQCAGGSHYTAKISRAPLAPNREMASRCPGGDTLHSHCGSLAGTYTRTQPHSPCR